MLGVSRTTLYKMFAEGRLARVQPSGRAVRVRLSDVQAIMAGRTD